MNQLKVFKIFVELSKKRSFSKVAESEQCHVSSISRQIEELENEIGFRLFNRTTRSVSLTSAGEIYLNRIQGILSSFEEAKFEASLSQEHLKGRIKVAAPVSFARLHMGNLVTKFLNLHSDISISLITNNSFENLIDEGYDFAIRIGSHKDSSYVSKKISDAKKILCASPLYLHKSGNLAKPEDLKNHNCLISDYKTKGIRWYYSRGKTTHAIEISGSLQSNQGDVIVEAAKKGLGIAILPLWLIQKELAEGSLVAVLKEYDWNLSKGQVSAIQIVYPHRKTLTKVARAFIDFLLIELQ